MKLTAKQALAKLRCQCKNQLQLVGALLKSQRLQVRGRQICAATEPIRRFHIESIHNLKGQQSALRWQSLRAARGWRDHVRAIARTVHDVATLKRPAPVVQDSGGLGGSGISV